MSQNQDEQFALIRASFNGHTKSVKILIDKQANLDLQDECGNTALIWACINNYREITKMLLTPKSGMGANPKLQNNFGWTALMWVCCHHNNIEIVKILIDKGANIGLQHKDKRTALMLLCRYPYHIESVALILEHMD